jgi:hypothetical protein
MKRIIEDFAVSSRDINIDGEDKETIEHAPVTKENITIDDLPKQMFGASLKGIDGYRDLRKQKKIEKLEKQFIDELSKIMKLFENEKKYDSQLVQFVMQLAEHYFILYSKMGENKENAVIQVVKQFYNNDDELVRSIIKLVLPNIKKTNILRRTSARLQRLFLYVLTRLTH